MATLTEDKQKLFYFLRDVYQMCENGTPFSFNAKMHEHGVYANQTREALQQVKLFEPTGEKEGRTPYYRWLAPVPPNIETATKLDEKIKKIRNNGKAKVKGNGHDKKETAQIAPVKTIKHEKAYDSKGETVKPEPKTTKKPDAFVIRIPKAYVQNVYSLGKYLAAAGAGYVIRLIIEKL